MNKKQRLQAALRGEVPDRVPASIWLHNFAQEHSAQALFAQTVRLAERFDLDLVKPQMRPHCFGQMWGQEFTRSMRADEWPVVTRHALRDDADLAQIGPRDGRTGALGEQVEAIRLLRSEFGPDVPMVATVFSPMMNLTLMHAGGAAAALQLQRSAPQALQRAFDCMTDTLSQFAAACLDAGADGIFYATQAINHGQTTRQEWERFQQPCDARILAAAKDGWANILHICGPAIEAAWFQDYPAPLVSWATTPPNPDIPAMRARTGRTVLAGMPGKPAFAQMTPEALRAHVSASLEATGGVGHVLGPDCSINPGTPDALIDAVFEAARAFRPRRLDA